MYLAESKANNILDEVKAHLKKTEKIRKILKILKPIQKKLNFQAYQGV